MRLTPPQAEAIRLTVGEVFGKDAEVWLFGSRVDDGARGGDIDLYVESPAPLVDAMAKISRMYAALQAKLGEQKMDIVVWSPAQKWLSVHEEAKRTGVRL
ncbi:MAG: nucleotidyltransferase domain-containing protein [Sulfuricella sp.]|nr:nucleotidyltransferase domain-containing protein [Sulfuricella sp.]